MELKDILFGKEKIITDEKIGILKARIKKTHLSISYVWASEVLLKGQKKETVIILEGNATGPYNSQLNSAYSIVDNLEYLKEQINQESKRNNSNYKKYNGEWIKDFYLAAITPIEVRDNSFEVNFEPIDENDKGYVLFNWTNNLISGIEIK